MIKSREERKAERKAGKTGTRPVANILLSGKNIVFATLSAAAGTTTVVAQGTGWIASKADNLPEYVGDVIEVTKAVALAPFDAREEQLVTQGVARTDAHARAYKVIDRHMAESVTAMAKGAGRGFQALSDMEA